MGFIKNIRALFTRSAGSEQILTADNFLQTLLGGTLTREQALEIPAVAASAAFVSGVISMLPIKLYRENAGKRETEEITDDKRVALLNDDAKDTMLSAEMKQEFIRDVLLDGAGFIYIDRVGNGVRSLRYVSARDVSVQFNGDPMFREALLLVGANKYYPWKFISMTRATKNGLTGVGIVKEHAEILSAAYMMLKLEKMLASTGGNKKGFLQSQRKLGDPEIKKLRKAWDELYAKTSSSMMILNDGMTFTPSSNTAVEMQLNQSKTANTAQLSMLFGLNPDVISGRASTDVYMSSIKTGVLPLVKKFEDAINRALLLESEKPSMYFAVDTSELLKGDMRTRYEAYRIGLEANFLQPDEIRYKEDLPPLGLNFIKLGLNDVLYDPKTGVIYTPNTDKAAQMSGTMLTDKAESGIIEDRDNEDVDYIQDPDTGLMNGSRPKGGGTPPVDLKGKPFNRPTFYLPKQEYSKVYSEIGTNYSKYEGKPIAYHLSVDEEGYHYYAFENHGFGDYNIFGKDDC